MKYLRQVEAGETVVIVRSDQAIASPLLKSRLYGLSGFRVRSLLRNPVSESLI
ncbi:hypothetical protein [Floridanema aerugineum]|uniref:Uncharacterized protein n=1 Tax=Floridaenema aerugineum BLCC-F46 TaxID=3153654 RepID=A0ABV4WYK1_9CYAN